MDGKPALDLLDLIVTGLHGNTNQSKQVEKDLFTSPTRNLGKIDDLNSVDFVSSNANSCHKEAIVHFGKSYICSDKLDVQETDCCFAQFKKI